METSLKQYISYEYLNTYESMYLPKSNEPANMNFAIFLNEFYKKTQG